MVRTFILYLSDDCSDQFGFTSISEYASDGRVVDDGSGVGTHIARLCAAVDDVRFGSKALHFSKLSLLISFDALGSW